MGESGVLNFFLEILSTHALKYALQIHVLRLIGNACADTGINYPLDGLPEDADLAQTRIELVLLNRITYLTL